MNVCAIGDCNGKLMLAHSRLFNSPLAEGAIVSTAVGYALSGGRAMVELMYADFIGCAGDEFFFPQASWILDAIHEKFLPLPGYIAENGCTEEEALRRAAKGV